MPVSAPPGRKGRFLLAGFAAALLAGLLALAPNAAKAGPALVFDVRSGEVLHAHEPFARWYPASLTKMMTAYVAFQAIRQGRVRLDTPVTISPMAFNQAPTKMGFPIGTTLSLDYALRIIIVRSANDISVAIGEAVSGDLDTFVHEMNVAAARLGMTDTRFANPHGLPDSRQVSTARDLALLTRALIREFPQYQFYFETQAIQVDARSLANHNRLLGRFQGADGMKTGYTCSSGFNLAASATRNGRRLVAIVLGGSSAQQRNDVAAGLLEAGFKKGGGFRLFSRAGPSLTDLRRPPDLAGPVDLRPYVCHGREMPARLASFGIDDGTSVAAGYLAGDPEETAVTALTAPAEVEMGARTSSAAPAIAFTIPIPRPRPLLSSTSSAAALPVDPAAPANRAGATQLRMPEALRTPLR